MKGFMMWLVTFLVTCVICTTTLPDYLPVDGTLDFLPGLIMLIVGVGGLITVMGWFKIKGSGD